MGKDNIISFTRVILFLQPSCLAMLCQKMPNWHSSNKGSHIPTNDRQEIPWSTLYFRLRNKHHILPLQQNPPQLPSLVLLRIYLNSIINHQVYKLIESLQLLTAQKENDGTGTYSDVSFNSTINLFVQPNLNGNLLLQKLED